MADTGFPFLRVLCAVSIVAISAATACAQSTVMITEDSVLRDASGSDITHSEFFTLIDTGRYGTEPITDDSGKVIGYRLVNSGEAVAAGEAGRAAGTRIQSTPINDATPIDLIRYHYLFLPIDLHDGETWREYLVVLDTGTFVPLILDPELPVGEEQKARVGGVEFSSFPSGRFEPFDVIRDMNRFRQERPDLFGDRRIVGIAGISLFQNYLASIDAASSRLTLRPLDSERRTLHEIDPIVSVRYRPDMGNIWLPVNINGVSGFAHYDTGSPHTFVADEILERGEGRLESMVIAGVELANALHTNPDGDSPATQSKDLGPAYESVPFDVIAQFGCDGSDRWIVTIDPRDTRVYFERSH